MKKLPATKPKSEANVQAEILLEFGARDDMLLSREQVGTFLSMGGKQVVKIGTKGRPDIMGVWRRELQVRKLNTNSPFQHHEDLQMKRVGFAIAIETKAKGGKLSADQERWKKAFLKVGGIYILAYCVDDVYHALKTVEDRW